MRINDKEYIEILKLIYWLHNMIRDDSGTWVKHQCYISKLESRLWDILKDME